MESVQDERSIFYARLMAHLALTKAFLQAAVTAAMQCQPEQCTNPPPPVVFSKQIAPTDNMWSKTDDAKKCHWLLKG